MNIKKTPERDLIINAVFIIAAMIVLWFLAGVAAAAFEQVVVFMLFVIYLFGATND